jgi:hypothetical protein
MQSATARDIGSTTAEEVGQATLQIVHDLKNQLNGLKLYATFLRKRLEQRNDSSEEQEILAKLIAGLDGAAREMTTLVRFARPLELRQRPEADLKKIILPEEVLATAQKSRSLRSNLLRNRLLIPLSSLSRQTSSVRNWLRRGHSGVAEPAEENRKGGEQLHPGREEQSSRIPGTPGHNLSREQQ